MAKGQVLHTIDKAFLDGLVDGLQLQPLTSQQAEGKPLHRFVRGLIFSTQLVDFIENNLPNGYHAGWGQLIDDQGEWLSSENDIIVYRGKPEHEWKTTCLKFMLVQASQANVVIQCRAIVRTVDSDLRTYARQLSEFRSRLWLFAECCWAKSAQRCEQIRQDTLSAGYERFFYLYDHSYNSDVTKNYLGWREFREAIRALDKEQTRRRR